MECVFTENGPDTIIKRIERPSSQEPSKTDSLREKSNFNQGLSSVRASARASARQREAAMQKVVDKIFPGKGIDLSERLLVPSVGGQIYETQEDSATDENKKQIALTIGKILEIFSDEEKKDIFGSTSSATVKKNLQGLPSIYVKDGQMEKFKAHIQTFGVNGFRSWPKFAAFRSVIEFTDVLTDTSIDDSKKNIRAIQDYVGDTGGVLVRACRERADSEYAFCSWIIFNELNELIPNVGWGPSPPIPKYPPYRITDLPIKGKALVATRTIKYGETILKERPIVIGALFIPISTEAYDEFYGVVLSVLSPEDRDAFVNLSDAGKPVSHGPRLRRVAETNHMGIKFPQSKRIQNYGGIFKIVSRCCHSCSPTAVHSFSSETLVLELRATRNIKAGEEITISYAGLEKIASVRQEELKRRYQFECVCEVCSLEPVKLKESDERRKRIAALDLAMSVRLWVSAADRSIQSSKGTGAPAGLQSMLAMMQNRTEDSPRMDYIFDVATNEWIRLWTTEDVKMIHDRIKRFINLHMDILNAVRAENLNSEQFGLIRWIVRAYAALGDEKNTKRWSAEAKKALKTSTDKYGIFRDTDSDSVHAWDQIVQDPTRHPEWNGIEKKYQEYKKMRTEMTHDQK